MKYALYGFLILVLVASCKKSGSDDLELIPIANGALYGAGSEGFSEENIVIRKKKDWESFIEKVDAVNSESENFSEKDIDFSDYMVIACIDEVRGSGGYAIDIEDAIKENKTIEVTVVRTAPQSEFVPAVITQPYTIYKISKSKKKVVFN